MKIKFVQNLHLKYNDFFDNLHFSQYNYIFIENKIDETIKILDKREIFEIIFN
jgi:hypothetical protein